MTISPQLIQPPAKLLIPVTDPTTNQPGYAFPLQTTAWLKMQDVVRIALSFPLTTDDFTNLYGTFTDEATVETAITVLGAIQKSAGDYGDPLTLISGLAAFQTANTAPDPIYGNAVWLAAQTITTAQTIATMLKEGLNDIATESDPKIRIQDLTELLTGQGGITSMSTTLQGQIGAFQTKTTTFYTVLNTELTGQTNSLEWYLNQSDNVYALAKQDAKNVQDAIDQLNSQIKQLNDEYIGFTVAASVSPVLLLVPFFGPFLAIADAATFGALAAKVKQQMDGLKQTLSGDEVELQKKSALVTQLGNFDDQAKTVDVDGKAFLNSISTLISGWGEFNTQVQARLTALTVADVQDWSAFMDKVGFQSALDGWNLIAQKAESFYQAGFVQFTKQTS
jgi:hypothetical protein